MLVILWSHSNVIKRTFGSLTERSYMVLCWSYYNVPDMTLGERSVLVIIWSHSNVIKRTFGTLTERSHTGGSRHRTWLVFWLDPVRHSSG